MKDNTQETMTQKQLQPISSADTNYAVAFEAITFAIVLIIAFLLYW